MQTVWQATGLLSELQALFIHPAHRRENQAQWVSLAAATMNAWSKYSSDQS
jgi:hypothetical protein